MRIEIEELHGRLVMDKWQFAVATEVYGGSKGVSVTLSYYGRYTRPSARHRKWERQDFYQKLFPHSRLDRWQLQLPPTVPLPVFEELVSRLQNAITYEFEH